MRSVQPDPGRRSGPFWPLPAPDLAAAGVSGEAREFFLYSQERREPRWAPAGNADLHGPRAQIRAGTVGGQAAAAK